MDLIKLEFDSSRRFGVELELNSFDKRDFYSNPLNTTLGELPLGSDEIAILLNSKLGFNVKIMKYHHTHNNLVWVIKPDRSCGIEVCSPVSKGWTGIKSICEVVDLFSREKEISADSRCSFHIHVDVSDCSKEQVAKILTYWIKCEAIFLDSVPLQRKRNKFCQCIGMTDLFEVDTPWDSSYIIKKLGNNKYYTANCEHLANGHRQTLEFRIAESTACIDPFYTKNWIKLILHFVECAKNAPIPPTYRPDNAWSGFSWFDLEDVFTFLKFTDYFELSKGMEQTRNWFLARIASNLNSTLPGIWSQNARRITKEQSEKLLNRFNITSIEDILKPTNPDLIYSSEYK